MMPGKSAFLALAAVGGLALSGAAASAQGLGGSWYVKGFGGLTVPQDDDFRLGLRGTDESVDTGFDFDNGYVLGIAGGFMATPNIAVELEYAYRNADASLKDLDTGSKTTESNAFMVNALYYLTPTGPWQPYVGGGLGAADLSYEEIEPDSGGDFDSDYNFAYQLIGGVGYALSPQITLNGEVRFFGINDQTLENDLLRFKTGYQTFDVLIGATYHF